jgi:hypothetical protein
MPGSAPVLGDGVLRLQAAYERAEELTDEAAEAERKAFDCWEQARGAYEVVRDESDHAWRAYMAAVGD